MILFFRTPSKSVIAVECDHELTQADSDKLCWLFGEATPESEDNLKGYILSSVSWVRHTLRARKRLRQCLTQ